MNLVESADGHVLDVFDPRCPSRGALRDVTGRWAPLILLALDDGVTRFGDLRRSIGGSNERMLSQTLTTLTDDGLVLRDLDETGRPFYELTPGGRTIAGRLRDLRDAIYAHLAAPAQSALRAFPDPLRAEPIGQGHHARRTVAPGDPRHPAYDGVMSRTDTASLVIGATPERVYAAFVSPQALAVWLPPEGMSGRFERFDARPGGSYRMVLTYADASAAPGKATADSDIVEARFVELIPGVRVVQAVDFVSDDPCYAGTMTMTWEVAAVDNGSLVTLRADNVPAGISEEDHAAGMASSLANLAAFTAQ